MTTTVAALDDPRWDAVRGRRPDPSFVFAVRTTRIACRPGCPSRTPSRGNVTFFADFAAAQRAGYRACKRCAPDDVAADADRRRLVERACALIDGDDRVTLDDVARAVGFSRFHFQRVFRSVVGITPGEYRRARYDAATRAPRAKHGERLTYAIAACSLGRVLVACSDRGICAIELGDDDDAVHAAFTRHFPHAAAERDDAGLRATVERVVRSVDDPRNAVDLPLDVRGTAFQRKVWNALRAIPLGAPVSYAALARAIGAPRAAQAVGAACGANRLAVAIPCHRVVREDGGLAGYRWGVERKKALLEREATP